MREIFARGNDGYDVPLINRGFHELNPLLVGEQVCAAGHRYGPAMRHYTLIHFVASGEGVFCRGGEQYTVRKGEAFVILPDEVTLYYASEEDPWTYRWVGFDGALSARFSELSPVFSCSRGWGEEMIAALENDGMSEYRIASLLFQLYADLFSSEKPNNHYVRRVKNLINTLYMQDLRVEEIAEKMNLDRRYLSRLFKEKTGQTVQEYLIGVRMEAAKKQLLRGASVWEAAKLSGYEDVCNFSKMFKRCVGVSPGNWKKETETEKGIASDGTEEKTDHLL